MQVRPVLARIALFLMMLGLSAPASGQLATTRVATQTSTSVSCNEPGCDCVVNGVPALCPGTNVRNYDSGNVAGPTSDSYLPTVSGHFVGFDGYTDVDATVNGDATFGTLHALSSGSSAAGGSYVLAGGLAIPGTSLGYVSVENADVLTIGGPPGAAASVTFTQVISSLSSASVGTGSGVDPCLANAVATVLLNATLVASSPTSGAGDVKQYARLGNACTPIHDNGSPIGAITLNLHTGDKVNLGHLMTLNTEARINGGLGPPTNPNRVLASDAFLDASHSAKLYVDVLTPGASYTSASGTIYRTPELDSATGLAASVAALALLAGRRRNCAGPGA